MEVSEIIVAGIITLIVQYVIITYAVHNATAVMRQHAKIQTALLCEMARKAGVTEEQIQEAFNAGGK